MAIDFVREGVLRPQKAQTQLQRSQWESKRVPLKFERCNMGLMVIKHMRQTAIWLMSLMVSPFPFNWLSLFNLRSCFTDRWQTSSHIWRKNAAKIIQLTAMFYIDMIFVVDATLAYVANISIDQQCVNKVGAGSHMCRVSDFDFF